MQLKGLNILKNAELYSVISTIHKSSIRSKMRQQDRTEVVASSVLSLPFGIVTEILVFPSFIPTVTDILNRNYTAGFHLIIRAFPKCPPSYLCHDATSLNLTLTDKFKNIYQLYIPI